VDRWHRMPFIGVHPGGNALVGSGLDAWSAVDAATGANGVRVSQARCAVRGERGAGGLETVPVGSRCCPLAPCLARGVMLPLLVMCPRGNHEYSD
jgi:hypothetical protein